MSTNVYQNGPSKNNRLPSKPNKSPPPPPLPPKNSSPFQSNISLTTRSIGAFSDAGGGGSEYADSVYGKAFSTRSLQPHTMSPNISNQYISSRSVCSRDLHNYNYHRCCSHTPTTCSPYHYQIPNCHSPNCQPSNCQTFNQSAASSYHSIHNGISCHHGVCNTYDGPSHLVDIHKNLNKPLPQNPPSIGGCGSSVGQMSPDIVDIGKYTPQIAPRISRRPILQENRPRQSISPLPDVKPNTTELNGVPRYHENCSSFYYRRHIETHIERLFKYLKEREQRLEQCEEELKESIDQKSGNLTDAERIRIASICKTLLVKKESKYLRNFRQRLGPSDFKELKVLGCGFIGKVSLVEKIAKNGEKPMLYAMKKLSKGQVLEQNQIAHVMAERDILAEADNEWIVKLFYSFQDSQFLYFILEFIPGGDMMSLLCRENYLKEDVARFYIAEISLALQFVHDMKFIHRDMKPDNILIDAQGHIKLTDFGLCTGFRWTHDMKYYKDDNGNLDDHYHDENKLSHADESDINDDDCRTITKGLTQRQLEHLRKRKTLSCVGSPHYIAPEVLLNQLEHDMDGVNERLSDWWSVGVILYEMVIGYGPFIDLEAVRNNNYDPTKDRTEAVQERIVNFSKYLKIPGPNDGGLLLTGQPISPQTESLIRGLLCNYQDRLCKNGIRDLQEHAFFDGVDWVNIRKSKAPDIPKLASEHDTKYFPDEYAAPPSHNSENSLGATPPGSMPINGFTYRNFFAR